MSEQDHRERLLADDADDPRQPCSGCGYMILGGSLCGDCREYGPPRGWRWEYDPVADVHKRVPRV